MRTYLVTGGAGFIGSNYIHYMFKKYGDEIRIINVDVLTYAGNLENLKDIEDRPNYTFVRADICDKEAIAKILQVYETEIEEDSTFSGDLCADSIDMVQILKYVEEKLDIRIDDADLEQVVTVKDAAELIKAVKEKP